MDSIKHFHNLPHYVRTSHADNACWEIQQAQPDIIVYDPASGTYRRPTVTVSVDVHTGMIAGFHIAYVEPALEAVAQALHDASCTKQDLCSSVPDLRWD